MSLKTNLNFTLLRKEEFEKKESFFYSAVLNSKAQDSRNTYGMQRLYTRIDGIPLKGCHLKMDLSLQAREKVILFAVNTEIKDSKL